MPEYISCIKYWKYKLTINMAWMCPISIYLMLENKINNIQDKGMPNANRLCASHSSSES